MIPRLNIESIALVLFFVFCQVIGTMCVLPDVSMAEPSASFVENIMVCPMDGTIMCPPSATSSPERQAKHGCSGDVDPVMTFSTQSPDASISACFPLSYRSRASSIVPIAIAASSVLRI